MGNYIKCGSPKGKVKWLLAEVQGAEEVSKEAARNLMKENRVGIICVVDNGGFEAAGYAFSMGEFEAFADGDGDDRRLKRWVSMPKDTAERLSGYDAPVGGG